MMITIKCPKCDVNGSISLLKADYEGPYKCWKCRSLFNIQLKDNELKSCEPLSQEEFDRLQEIQALKNKYKKD